MIFTDSLGQLFQCFHLVTVAIIPSCLLPRMISSPLLEPDVASLVSSPGVGIRTPPYIPAYNQPEYTFMHYGLWLWWWSHFGHGYHPRMLYNTVLHHIVASRFTFAAKMLIFQNGWQATPRCLCCPKELHHHYCYPKVSATMLVIYINTNTNT